MEPNSETQAAIIYAGPSLFGVTFDFRSTSDIVVKPPIKRGDIQNLLSEQVVPGVIIIVDGYFHSQPSVGHSEILTALRRGWRIWGLASMGAIRAFEMKDYGMQGWGYVYEQFLKHPDFTDDEVTLLHSDDERYAPVTEPMVNFRYFLEKLVHSGEISAVSAKRIADEFSEKPFSERYKSEFLRMIWKETSSLDLEALGIRFNKCRRKALDVDGFMSEAPWRVSCR